MSNATLHIVPAAPRGDIIRLQNIISKIEDDLRSTNEKLGNLRQLIRTESNIKSRDIYLNKVCDMVKEQHRIRSILHSHRSKLKRLESKKKLKFVTKQIPQQAKNSKLLELFHNYETKTARNSEAPKRKILDNEETVNGEDKPAKQIIIDNHGRTMKCLKAHVKKRITEEEQKLVVPQIVKVEQAKYSDDDTLTLEETKPETEELPISQEEKLVVKIEIDEESEYIKETEQIEEEKPELSVETPQANTIVISNHRDAMQCLKALQEYAMLNENYRAIGLLSETEKAFVSPADVTDFEL
ncbi:uncharacterized protein LOC6581866 isoform X2 [Drosophila mojavensis]|uniref:Uncharacterized protein, isoform B n=1 Tax=Drosophila mojavensis TaxID=7230 RepID=A0A0Q9XBP8_DROMO|nr:uncharacterized protein LOC6581866 isoform X2 [Drosophila mojavensis]KRG05947.1 uncharacterized protein Dmoj_GI12296, isoform B [Drosophila mojavensis]